MLQKSMISLLICLLSGAAMSSLLFSQTIASSTCTARDWKIIACNDTLAIYLNGQRTGSYTQIIAVHEKKAVITSGNPRGGGQP